MLFSGTKSMAIASHILYNCLCESYSNMRIVPYLLSMWAVFMKRDPAPRFVDSSAEGPYIFKAQQLCAKHLATSADLVWYSISDFPRTVMITMWLTRSNFRSSVAHRMPTTGEGINIILSDTRLSDDEQHFIERLIPGAKDKKDKLLFTIT